MHFLRLLSCCRQSSTDGPNGLIGHHHTVHDFERKVQNGRFHLAQHLVKVYVGLAVLQGLPTAEHHPQPGFQDAVDLFGDRIVGVTISIPALAVADDDVLHATARQHLSGKFTGEGSRACRRNVLCTQTERQLRFTHGRQIRGWWRNHDLYAGRRSGHGCEGVGKFLCLVE